MRTPRLAMAISAMIVVQLTFTMPSGVEAGRVKGPGSSWHGVRGQGDDEVEIRKMHRRYLQTVLRDSSDDKEKCSSKKDKSCAPSAAPSISLAPSEQPSPSPSAAPTVSQMPSISLVPSSEPSLSMQPSMEPTNEPTARPTPEPTSAPTQTPSGAPSSEPTISFPPTNEPSPRPTHFPTNEPSSPPSPAPTPAPSSAPTNSPAPTTTPMPSPAPSSAPTDAPSNSMPPSLGPTLDPTDSPTLDPLGFDTMIVQGPDDKTAFLSECRPDIPLNAAGLEDQLVAFSYVLNVESGSRPQLAIDSIQLRLQRALSEEFLNCVFSSGEEDFFTYTINSLPGDQNLGVGSCNDEQAVAGAACFIVEASFTAKIFYLSEEGERDMLKTVISDKNVKEKFENFLQTVFATDVMRPPRVVSTGFAAITNTAPPTISPAPTAKPTIIPTDYPTSAPIVPAPVDWSAPTYGGPPTDESSIVNDGNRGIVEDDTVSILWYTVAAIFAVALLVALYCLCFRQKRRQRRRRSRAPPVVYEKRIDVDSRSVDSSPSPPKEKYSKMDTSDEFYSLPTDEIYGKEDGYRSSPAFINDDETHITGYERTLETYRATEKTQERAIDPVFVPTQEMIQNVSTDELNHAIDELYRPRSAQHPG